MKYLILLILCQSVFAAEMITIENQRGVYDIEMIVFARKLPQPSASSIKNADVIDFSDARVLDHNEELLPLFQPIEEATTHTEGQNDSWNIPINKKKNLMRALVWYYQNPEKDFRLTAVADKLKTDRQLKTLMHVRWRQAPTSFRRPQYIAINSAAEDDRINSEIPIGEIQDSIFNTTEPQQRFRHEETTPQLIPDFTVSGKVAFSSGRFRHLHVKLNLIRVNEDMENIVYAIEEQRRIRVNTLHYFDHPAFGVIIKIYPATF
ncbi:MAG: peptidoglycan binding protein CsiV [Proteobacteria bacterium]|nr:peptidoglycan binding protein CsiV [Pseudomonadota bacterium]